MLSHRHVRWGGQFLSSPPLSPQCCHQVPIYWWVGSGRAFNQGIESGSNRRPSAREACALTTMLPSLKVLVCLFMEWTPAIEIPSCVPGFNGIK